MPFWKNFAATRAHPSFGTDVRLDATGVTMSKQKQSADHVDAVQGRRASGAHGPHQDRRCRRARTRNAALRRELDSQ